MAHILFHKSVRLFGENIKGKGINQKFSVFEGNFEVEYLTQCIANKSIDFIYDGFVYREISHHLLEIIS